MWKPSNGSYSASKTERSISMTVAPNSTLHLAGRYSWPTRPGRDRLLEGRPGRVGLVDPARK